MKFVCSVAGMFLAMIAAYIVVTVNGWEGEWDNQPFLAARMAAIPGLVIGFAIGAVIDYVRE